MQIVIDIPETLVKDLLDLEDDCDGGTDIRPLELVIEAIKNGTPIDLEGLKSDMKALNCGYPYGLDYLLDCLKNRLGITVIEADKEVEE